MNEKLQPLDTLHDIKQMMERSSRFKSLSGLSGVGAGLCALAGVWLAQSKINEYYFYVNGKPNEHIPESGRYVLVNQLLLIAAATFFSAFILAFLFTWLRSKKNNLPLLSSTSKRLMINISIPMLTGAVFLLKLVETDAYDLIAPGCLIFYGLALVNASKYTLSEVRYLGFGQLVLGLINLWYMSNSLYFWAAGFGVLHIFYGTFMWWKYEKS
jgi:hypothetical protein